jgi:hypothetical protein
MNGPHPFDMTFVLLIATVALPLPATLKAAIWTTLVIVGVQFLRRRSRQRAIELSGATGDDP